LGKRRLSSDSADSSPNDQLNPVQSFKCTLTPSCMEMTFLSVDAFERHHQQLHGMVCHVCKRALPTPHLLELHLQELHDSFFQVKAAAEGRGYQCLVETCIDKFNTPRGRRLHCIAKHGYPTFYDFDAVLGHTFTDLVSGNVRAFHVKQASLQQRGTKLASSSKPSSKTVQTNPSAESNQPTQGSTDDMELNTAFQKLHVTAPQQISFGRGAHRAFGKAQTRSSRPMTDEEAKRLHTQNIPATPKQSSSNSTSDSLPHLKMSSFSETTRSSTSNVPTAHRFN